MVHLWTVGRCIVYTGIRLLVFIRPFTSSFVFLSNFQTLKFFVTFFSGTVRPRRLKLGTHVDSGQMYRLHQNQAAALIHPFISSFFFLSNFQTFKIFVTLFSETVWPRRLKLGTHVDSGQLYRVYQNQAADAYSFLYFSFFFLSNFQTLTFSSYFSQELWYLEDWNLAHTWTVDRCIVYTVFRLLLFICPFIASFFFLSNFQIFKIFVALFSETIWPRRLKLGTHMDSEQMYRLYRNQAAAAYSSF